MPTGSRLSIAPPAGFRLARDVCSYGYFLLRPNHWSVADQTLTRVLNLPEGPATCVIAQPAAAIAATFDRTLAPAERNAARTQIARMLRFDEDADHARAFHAVDPRWQQDGRARLFRSPTLFEDMIKTITSCNVAWPSTINMNTQLCRHLGRGGAFPTAQRVARARVGTLRGRCRVGYRDRRIIDLAKLFVRGEIDETWLHDPATADGDVFAFLKSLPGIGPYAAGNIMMLLGRYSRLAIDTETVRHGRAALGMTGTDRQVIKQLEAHYEPFGAYKFKSYWFELWAYYERKRGPAHLWDRETTGRTFTASQLD
jgi:3-methyladenine DNA glycosylase/8-oxoguanine DNA glycosylase